MTMNEIADEQHSYSNQSYLLDQTIDKAAAMLAKSAKPFEAEVENFVATQAEIDAMVSNILTPKSNKIRFRPTFFFDPSNFLLLEQRFMVPGTQRSLTIKYLNHQKLEGEFVPGEVQISLFDGSALTRIKLEYTRADFPNQLSIPFDIPAGYQPIEM